jgi:uncharacterized protein YndB with AHSA1/START domain
MTEDEKLVVDPNAIVRSITVQIAAPAQVVWDVLVDFGRYSEWNPFCVEASGVLEVGEPLSMKLKSYTEEGQYFDNVEFITEIDEPRLVSWSAPWVDEWPYPARRDQFVVSTGPDSCEYYSTDAFLGPHGIHVMRFAGPWVKRAFDDTARALKAYVEAN